MVHHDEGDEVRDDGNCRNTIHLVRENGGELLETFTVLSICFFASIEVPHLAVGMANAMTRNRAKRCTDLRVLRLAEVAVLGFARTLAYRTAALVDVGVHELSKALSVVVHSGLGEYVSVRMLTTVCQNSFQFFSFSKKF